MRNLTSYLKNDPIIDEKYQPSMDQNYLDYFNRALTFALTNYKEQIVRLQNINLDTLTPDSFFKEYIWCVCITPESVNVPYFTELCILLEPYCGSFNYLNDFPNKEVIKNNILPIIKNEDKCDAFHKMAYIIKNGIKLWSWKSYRMNFLNSIDKLECLPYINRNNSKELAFNIGLKNPRISDNNLHYMAVHWGFDHPEQLYEAISKRIVMKTKIISQILWYAAMTFGVKKIKTLI